MYSVSNRVANKQTDGGMVEQLRSLKVKIREATSGHFVTRDNGRVND